MTAQTQPINIALSIAGRLIRYFDFLFSPALLIPMLAFLAGLIVNACSYGREAFSLQWVVVGIMFLGFGEVTIIGFYLVGRFIPELRRIRESGGKEDGWDLIDLWVFRLGAVAGILIPLGVLARARSWDNLGIASVGLLLTVIYANLDVSSKRGRYLAPVFRFLLLVFVPFLWGVGVFYLEYLVESEFLGLVLILILLQARAEFPGPEEGKIGFSIRDYTRLLLGSIPFLLFAAGIWKGVFMARYFYFFREACVGIFTLVFTGEVLFRVFHHRMPRWGKIYLPYLPLVLGLLVVIFSYYHGRFTII